MGKFKDWAMSEQLCIVCDREFFPFEAMRSHAVDIRAPTCSRRCYDEKNHVLNAVADMQEEYPQEGLETAAS